MVCHLHEVDVPDADERDPYPRHFGVTFHDAADVERLLHLCRTRTLPFFREPATRFTGLVEEHTTVGLRHPSGNLLGYERYVDPRMKH